MEVESDSSALTRRIMLMEEEAMKAETNLANTVGALLTIQTQPYFHKQCKCK